MKMVTAGTSRSDVIKSKESKKVTVTFAIDKKY
jgi:hypothetical protein